jgi:hypothetical protein
MIVEIRRPDGGMDEDAEAVDPDVEVERVRLFAYADGGEDGDAGVGDLGLAEAWALRVAGIMGKMSDEDTHTNLQSDLMEHIWQESLN